MGQILFALSIVGVLAGCWLAIAAFRPSTPSRKVSLPSFTQETTSRAVRAVATALVLAAATRWPAALIAGGALGWWFTDIFGSKSRRQEEIARTEAIASWTEMLRDTLSGAHGLEETIITSADVAPAAIRREVVTLATTLEHEPIGVALRRFAKDLAHPTGDLVVAALVLASSGSTRNLAELLGTLAEAARDECGMRLRIEAARARMRTAVRVITICTLATAAGLVLFNGKYLDVYDDVTGQGVLVLILGSWAGALWWLSKMSQFEAPERFLLDVEEVQP